MGSVIGGANPEQTLLERDPGFFGTDAAGASSIVNGGGAEAAASGTPYGAIASGAGQAIQTGYNIYQNMAKDRQTKEDKRAMEQMSMRQEANRRQSRALLINQIESFYKKRGIPIPTEHAPGEGTYRPLPGDKNPYAGYDVDPSYMTHQPVDANGTPIPFDKNSPTGITQPTVTQPSEAQSALLLKQSPPQVNLDQAMRAGSVFHTPAHQAKGVMADIGAQATVPSQPDPSVTDVVPVAAPITVAIPTTPTTQLPSVWQVGKRYGF